jgi:predicted secreted hydrolase
MRVRSIFSAGLVWMCLAVSATAQGFAGLGSDAEGFAIPGPDPVFTFPRDHGAHPDYRIEWWYLTATLTGEDGREYGVQWTLFRSSLRPEGDVQLWMGHAGITTPDAHYSAERLARGGIGQADVQADPFAAWIDDWRMEGPDMDTLSVRAQTPEAAFDLALRAQGPLVFHGAGGYSVKSASGQASYYYSQPFYTVTGTLDLPEGPVRVTGQAWLDREWSSQPLEGNQAGWDWFSLHFTDGARLMGFGLRGTQGDVFTYASWIEADGTLTAQDDLVLTPLATARVEGREVPVEWRVQLPSKGLDITTSALNPQAWQDMIFPYWEGPVRATGTHKGRGYLEMTGYD